MEDKKLRSENKVISGMIQNTFVKRMMGTQLYQQYGPELASNRERIVSCAVTPEAKTLITVPLTNVVT